MRTRASRLFAVLLIALSTSKCRRPNGVDDERLRRADADTANWLMYGRTYDDHRFSPLTQINEQTIGKLGLGVEPRARDHTRSGSDAAGGGRRDLHHRRLERGVRDRREDRRRALDLRSQGAALERAFFICCDVVNRGVALYHGKVYVGTLDGRLDRARRAYRRPGVERRRPTTAKPYAITGAPRIAKGMVIIGNAGAEYGVRGYISAYDAETGQVAWRTYTVPGDPANGFESKAMEHAAKTWSGEWWKTGGGGTAWEGIVYDPALDLLYFGTGNATAWYRAIRGEGDRQSLHRLDPGRAREHRRTGVAFPDDARRQLGLRRDAAADAGRPDDRRPPAQGDHAGEQERLLLRSGS